MILRSALRPIWLIASFVLLSPLFAWQDDIDLNLRNPFSQFGVVQGLGVFRGANAEVRLGRYLSPESHHFRGGAEGDVALLTFGDTLLWHMGLNMETLADGQNEINFRLVHVYYQALTGVKIKLGPGLLQAGYRHRCSHGTDSATASRIIIRSGLTGSYQWVIPFGALRFDINPGVNLYLVGQNRDRVSQARGGAFIGATASWPIREPLYMKLGAGTNWELVSQGLNNLYGITDSFANWRVEPLYACKLALRIQQEKVTSDFGLHLAQNLDSGMGDNGSKTTAFSFDIDFLW